MAEIHDTIVDGENDDQNCGEMQAIQGVELKPGEPFVVQFVGFLSNMDAPGPVCVKQNLSSRVDVNDPYSAFLLEHPEQIPEEIASIERFLRENEGRADVHKEVLIGFIQFLNRLQTYAQASVVRVQPAPNFKGVPDLMKKR